jgi:hypothetical protein
MKTCYRAALRPSGAHRNQPGASFASEVFCGMHKNPNALGFSSLSDFTARETISAIAERLRLLGCTEQQIDKHVTSLRGALKPKKHRLRSRKQTVI